MKKFILCIEQTSKIMQKFIEALYTLGAVICLFGTLFFGVNNFLNEYIIILGFSFLLLIAANVLRLIDFDASWTDKVLNTSLKLTGKDYPISTSILLLFQIVISLGYNEFKSFKIHYINILCVSPTIIIILQIYFSRQIRIEKMLKELTAKQNSERSSSGYDKNDA